MVIMMRVVVPESGFIMGTWSIFDEGQELPEIVSGSTLHGMTETNPSDTPEASGGGGEAFFSFD